MILKKSIYKYLASALFALLAALFSINSQWMNKVENILYDLRVQVLSSQNKPSEDIKIIVIDQSSLKWADKSNGIGWPWPREMYSAVNNFLYQSGAKMVIYDMIYSEPSFYGNEDDKYFSSTLKQLPSIGAMFLTKGEDGLKKWPENAKKAEESYIDVCTDNDYNKLILPVEIISEGFGSLGLANSNASSDGIIRKIDFCYGFNEQKLPTLSMLAFQKLAKTKPQIKEKEAFINYYNAPFSFKTYTASSVINSWLQLDNGKKPDIKKDTFKDSVVFVGVSATGLHDNKATPLSNNHPGVDIQATVLDNLFQNNIIYKSSNLTLFILLVIGALSAALSLYYFNNIWAMVLTILSLTAVSFILAGCFYLFNSWLPLAPILFSIFISALISGIIGYIAEREQKREAILEKNRKIKELLDSFIKLIASAIDAKSKYTGGHCERVPRLLNMFVEEANNADFGAFKDFSIHSEDEKYELGLAGWLHDCGKVTTPEYVVDKATKLETIYNRIHEIRTRFEVIHRDLTIEALNKKLSGEDKKEVDRWLEKEHEKLHEEFKTVADANVGAEFMDDETKSKIKDISKRTWTRYFDHTLGLASEEKNRVIKENSPTPQTEKLLSDKPQHIIEREDFDYDDYEKMGFKGDVPLYLYNKGELYNLMIEKGTLTEEERFKINDHVRMTIKMLEELPFSDNLKNVPSYAGAHHETLIGTGYPRQLTKEQIPLPARMLALVDVFEALTASDRPYKEPKKLSDSIKILSFMVKDRHIDKDVFKLFLRSGVYKKYAEEFINPDQVDDVDIEKYL